MSIRKHAWRFSAAALSLSLAATPALAIDASEPTSEDEAPKPSARTMRTHMPFPHTGESDDVTMDVDEMNRSVEGWFREDGQAADYEVDADADAVTRTRTQRQTRQNRQNATSGQATAEAGQRTRSMQASQATLVPAHRLIGQPVYSQQGDRIGKIEDLLIKPQDGKLSAALISLSDRAQDATAVEAEHVAVPWSMLKPQFEPQGVTLDAPVQRIRRSAWVPAEGMAPGDRYANPERGNLTEELGYVGPSERLEDAADRDRDARASEGEELGTREPAQEAADEQADTDADTNQRAEDAAMAQPVDGRNQAGAAQDRSRQMDDDVPEGNDIKEARTRGYGAQHNEEPDDFE